MIIGSSKQAIDTPALWVDLDLMEENIEQLAGICRKAGVAWRPHCKGVKVPALCHKFLEAGAIGLTCAKLGEAEVMAAAGIRDLLIANQVVGDAKIARLVNLRPSADAIVAVDSLENANQISQAAVAKGVTIRVVIEVNIGINRCGVEPGQPVVDLARGLARLPGIMLVGVMGWEGQTVRIQERAEKEEACRQAVGALVRSADLCRAAGMHMPIVSCGGSGTYDITPFISGVTEVQTGGAVLNALDYRNRSGVGLHCALFIQATVISRPNGSRAVIDAGRKAMGSTFSLPQPRDLPGVKLEKLNAEHGILAVEDPQTQLRVDDKIDLVAGYVDDTVFLHDQIYGVRGGSVEAVWDVQARGRLT